MTPIKTHNLSSQIQFCEVCWSKDELDVFKGLGVPKEERESTYLTAYLSCWHCVFALLMIGDWLIRLETFDTANSMALDCTLSLTVLVLVSLCRGLNEIAHATKPSYLRSFFPCHYLYGWLAQYFWTHHLLHPAPLGPLMVRYSGPLTTRSNIRDAYKMIHKGKVPKLGCLMLAKN